MLRHGGLGMALMAGLFFVAGCIGGEEEFQEFSREDAKVDQHDHAHAHGPHGGDMIELGGHDLHAEVLFIEADSRVDLYLLGEDSSTNHPVALESVTISFAHGDEKEEFKLAARPIEGEGDGRSSRFSLKSEELLDEVQEHAEGATLSFEIDGKTYSGVVKYQHGHEEHAHDEHGDHDHGAAGHSEAAHGAEHGDHKVEGGSESGPAHGVKTPDQGADGAA